MNSPMTSTETRAAQLGFRGVSEAKTNRMYIFSKSLACGSSGIIGANLGLAEVSAWSS